MKIDLMAREVRATREANGFTCPDSIDGAENAEAMAAKLALVHSEVSEALEAVRKNDPANFREELADTVIRIMDIASTGGWSLEGEIRMKMSRNAMREHMHGGKQL